MASLFEEPVETAGARGLPEKPGLYELGPAPSEKSEHLARRARNINMHYMILKQDGKEVAWVEMGTPDYSTMLGRIKVRCDEGSVYMDFLNGGCTGASYKSGNVREKSRSIDELMGGKIADSEKVRGIISYLQENLSQKVSDCRCYFGDFFSIRKGSSRGEKSYKAPSISPGYAFA